MSQPIIQVRNLSKVYQLGSIGALSLKDELSRFWEKFRRPKSKDHGTTDGGADASASEYWALRDVSFDVQRGEVLGVIGRNGAGKSTLLKILSRITQQTTGEITLRGRVASLLEVGTGFHPDLTGRENIFLNGAILGMTKAEIRGKLDEIIAFAEVEKFIDTPVKRYSSGMYVRLAFAVAAHLEPEILIVDEVLAVGDAAFQRKCLGKMQDVASTGRTILFVSHSMAAVQRLCTKVLFLNAGKVGACGDVVTVSGMYISQGIKSGLEWRRPTTARDDVCFEQIYLADKALKPLSFITSAQQLIVVMIIDLRSAPRDLQLSMSLSDEKGEWIFSTAPEDIGLPPPQTQGRWQVVVKCPPDILMPRSYGLRCALWSRTSGPIEFIDDIRFSVASSNSFSEAHPSGRVGLLALKCGWEITKPACNTRPTNLTGKSLTAL